MLDSMDTIRLGLRVSSAPSTSPVDRSAPTRLRRLAVSRVGRHAASSVDMARSRRRSHVSSGWLAALDARIDIRLLWQGEGLDRLLDARHARLVDLVLDILTLERLGGRDGGLVQRLRRTRLDRHPRVSPRRRVASRHRDQVGRARHAVDARRPRSQGPPGRRYRPRTWLETDVGIAAPGPAERSDGSATGRRARCDIPDRLCRLERLSFAAWLDTPGRADQRRDVRVRCAPGGHSSTRSICRSGRSR